MVVVLMAWCFIVLPLLCWVVTRSSIRHYSSIEAAKIDAMRLELGRQAHDADTLIKSTVHTLEMEEATTIHDVVLDWEDL